MNNDFDTSNLQEGPRSRGKAKTFLPSVQRERDDNDQIPADHTDINKVHHPQAPPHPQHQEHSNHFAEHNAAHAAEVDGQIRDEWIYFKPSHAKCRQRREEVQNLKQNEAGSRVQRSQE
jgi:hypothetical protein